MQTHICLADVSHSHSPHKVICQCDWMAGRVFCSAQSTHWISFPFSVLQPSDFFPLQSTIFHSHLPFHVLYIYVYCINADVYASLFVFTFSLVFCLFAVCVSMMSVCLLIALSLLLVGLWLSLHPSDAQHPPTTLENTHTRAHTRTRTHTQPFSLGFLKSGQTAERVSDSTICTSKNDWRGF